MKIDIIQTDSDFIAQKSDWNSLLIKSARDVPFLRHEFLSNWWATFGGGEWDQGDLFILTGRDQSGVLQGIAPFFINNQRILFLGSYEISDYLDFIASEDQIPVFINQVFDILETGQISDWKVLDLYNLLEDSPTIPVLHKAAKSHSWQIKQERIQPAPFLTLPGSWDEYLAELDDHYRHEIDRKIRRAEEYFLPVSWYIADDEGNLEQELNSFLELMANNQEKAAFLTDKMIIQIKDAARDAFQAGWLQLAFLTVGDIKAAGYLNFDYNGVVWIYNSGINPMFENLSPGWVLLSKIIQWSIEEQKTKLDFMRGDELYKYQFGGIDKHVLRIQITRE
ncbi:MAG: GNAT family N-acetyltransferase [Anaerolineales bacterium]